MSVPFEDNSAEEYSRKALAPWRQRLREFFWAHTDFKIKKLEGIYVDDDKEPKLDILEVVVLTLLVINMIVLAIFDPLNPNSTRSDVAQYMDLALSCLFFLEAGIRFLSFGYSVFVSDKWNLIDLIIVLLSLISAIMEAAGISLGNFTILRTVRVFRPLRSVTTLPAARTLVVSIYSAIKSLEDVTVLYLLFIISFSIIGVTQFMGRLKTRCVRDEYKNFTVNTTSFIQQYPFAANYSIDNFVCGGEFEDRANLVQSIGCGLDATCSNAQFLGNRLLVGYTCPWGYSCLEVGNPMFGFVSFDSVPQAMLTIFVGVTAEGLYRVAYQMMDSFDVTAAYFFLSIHILGTFFIVNLSVVLVTVTFEHVSSKIRNNKPKLVSKMAASLASGPRVFRRGTAPSGKSGNGRIQFTNADGTIGEISEENAYLVPELADQRIPDQERPRSLADVTQKLMTSEKFADHLQQRYAEELKAAREKEEKERKAKKEEETRLKSLADDSHGTKKKKVQFWDKLGNINLSGKENEESSEDEDEKEKTDMLSAKNKDDAEVARGKKRRASMKKNKRKKPIEGLFADPKAGYEYVVDEQEEERKRTAEEEERERNASKVKKMFKQIFTKDNFEILLNVIIIINVAIMCTYHYGSSPFLVNFFNFSNIIFACLFTGEFVLKLLAQGPRGYFRVPINVFDFVVVVLTIVDVTAAGDFPSVSAFRAIRLLKVMKSFPGILRWTVVILVSIKSSFLLLITIFVVNYCFAMFGLHMFGGTFCNLATEVDFRPDNTLDWCPNRPRANFDDVATAMLTTFQLMTGDGWDIVMYNAMRAKSWVVALAFVGYIVLMSFVLVNILVGILLSGPSREEVDLIGQKLFGISFTAKEKEELQKKEEEERKRTNSIGNLAQWEESIRGAQSGKTTARIDIKAFAERTMNAVPRKFIDSLEAVEDSILMSENAASVASSRRSLKRWLREGLSSRLVENMMLLMLTVSSLALAFETPESAPDDATAIILRILDIVFSVLFLVEILLNFYAYGMLKEADSYLRRDPWNVLDTVLVIANVFGTSTYFFFNSRWLKILLVVRAIRPLRFVKRSQGLRTVFSAFAMSAVPLKNIIFLALVIWTCWGLMAVQLFMGSFYSCSNSTLTTKQGCLSAGYNSSYFVPISNNSNVMVEKWQWVSDGNTWVNANLHFDHLGAAFLSLLTLATLDGGVDIMINGIDSVGIDIAPQVNYRQRVSLYFVSFIFIGGYFLINLVVSVIIETYNQEKMKSGDSGVFLTASQNVFLRSHRRILHGVPQIFYDEKHVSDFRVRMREIVQTQVFKNIAAGVSLINGCLLLADYYGAPQALRTIILICNTIFALVFTMEVAVKVLTLGWKRFFHSRFNQFDLFVTFCVFAGVIGELMFPDQGFTFIFRAMRSISLFRVVRNAEKLRHVISRFSYSLYGLANVGALLFIFLYIFGVMGVKSFGLIKYQGSLTRQINFNNVFRAILLLCNSLAGGGWAEHMSDCSVQAPYCDEHINNCGVLGWAQAYFVLFIIFTKFVLLNMFIAVILDSFVSTDFETISISKSHVKEFFEQWFCLDPDKTLRIESKHLVPFLRSLSSDNPLGFGGTELTRKVGHEFRFIQLLRLHEMENAIELQDLITALCDATLGVPLPDSEVRSLQKYADRKFHRKERELYIGRRGSENSRRVVERFAVHVIEHHFIDYKKRIGMRRKHSGGGGAASVALRSRAGGGADFQSKRDTLSYVDETMSFWGERQDQMADDNNNFEYDEITGTRKPKQIVGDPNDPAANAKNVIDARPELKKYLARLAEPLINADKKVRTRDYLENIAHVKVADTGSLALTDKEKEDAPELLRLLVDYQKSLWHDQEQVRIAETLRKKEPLGGRLVHAERVIENYRYERQVAELKDAERAFLEAVDDEDYDKNDVDAINDPMLYQERRQKQKERERREFDSSLREKGLLSQTELWSKRNANTNYHNNHQGLDRDEFHRQDFNSPVSSFYSKRERPEASIPGTYSAAGSAAMRNAHDSPRARRQNENFAVTTLHHAPSAAAQYFSSSSSSLRQQRNNSNNNNSSVLNNNSFNSLATANNIAIPASSSLRRKFQLGKNNDDDDDDHGDNMTMMTTMDAREMQSVLFGKSDTFLFSSPTAPVRSAGARPSSNPDNDWKAQEMMESRRKRNASSTAFPASPSSLYGAATSRSHQQQQQQAPHRRTIHDSKIDELEAAILLQELKEWKSGERTIPEKKVTRPEGYHKQFSATEYASL